MIRVLLRGGLGNQMFQYAHGLQLAAKYGGPVVLDTVYLDDRFPRRHFTYRTFALDVFQLHAERTRLSKLAAALPVPGLWLGLDLLTTKFVQALGRGEILTEARPTPSTKQVPIVVMDYWQSEKYFADVHDQVRAAFRPRLPLVGANEALARQMEGPNSVSLHVRRGDYLNPNMRALVGETNIEYYRHAVDHVRTRVQKPHFFVFSDDIAWCRNNLGLEAQTTTYIDPADSGPQGVHHLELMSRARHHIVANSSYSWWGAWLDARPDKLVVAPRRWYADGRANDIVPEAWTKL